MMVATAQQAAEEAAIWVAAFSQASEALQENTAGTVRSAWLGFEGWYEPILVAGLAAELADLSIAAQQTTAGLSAQYAAEAVAAVLGVPAKPLPRNLWTPVRGGAPMKLVHSRPAEVFKRAIATGATHQDALERAGARGVGLALSDLSLEDRAVQQEVFGRLGVEQYRRVIRPEMSKTGSCGLCIAAASRIYNTGDLMPLHPPSCNCIVLPIVGDNDPGFDLNEEDLAKLYDAAGSNKAVDLRRTGFTSLDELRSAPYAVHDHGELGPMIARTGDKFRGPNKVSLEDDPERAARMLSKVEPVLVSLEERAAAGENVSDPLTYQRELIARLRDIVDAAA
jgi:hypothetical protein